MARLWKSKRTGITYDTSSRDRHGNWEVHSDPDTELLNGALFLLGGVLLAGAAASSIALALGILTVLTPALLAMGLSRWPLTPLILIVAILIVRAQPGVLPRFRSQLRWLLIVAALMLPLSFVSMWSFGRSQPGLYAALAGTPILPVFALALTVFALVKRMWPVVWGTLTVLVVSTYPYLAGGLRVGGEFTQTSLAYDNVLATMIFIVLGGLLAVWRLRERRG